MINFKHNEIYDFLNKVIPYSQRVENLSLGTIQIDLAYSGVYLVKAFGECVYVGESKNIKLRLSDKRHPIYSKGVTFHSYDFDIFLYENDEDRFRAETFLVSVLHPVYNKINRLHGLVKKR